MSRVTCHRQIILSAGDIWSYRQLARLTSKPFSPLSVFHSFGIAYPRLRKEDEHLILSLYTVNLDRCRLIKRSILIPSLSQPGSIARRRTVRIEHCATAWTTLNGKAASYCRNSTFSVPSLRCSANILWEWLMFLFWVPSSSINI